MVSTVTLAKWIAAQGWPGTSERTDGKRYPTRAQWPRWYERAADPGGGSGSRVLFGLVDAREIALAHMLMEEGFEVAAAWDIASAIGPSGCPVAVRWSDGQVAVRALGAADFGVWSAAGAWSLIDPGVSVRRLARLFELKHLQPL